jgi:hypothetical protein
MIAGNAKLSGITGRKAPVSPSNSGLLETFQGLQPMNVRNAVICSSIEAASVRQ